MIILLVRWIHPTQYIAVMGASYSTGISGPGARRACSIFARSVLGRSRRMHREAGFESDGLCRKGERECRATVALGFERATELLG
jgi:hypothetical protein